MDRIPDLRKELYVRDCSGKGGLCLSRNRAYVVNNGS